MNYFLKRIQKSPKNKALNQEEDKKNDIGLSYISLIHSVMSSDVSLSITIADKLNSLQLTFRTGAPKVSFLKDM